MTYAQYHAVRSLLHRLCKDEQGGEVLESALVFGFIALAAIGIMGKVGRGVLLKWTAIADQL